MNKVTWIWKGDYNIEKNLPQDTAPITAFALTEQCGPDCRANAFALAGYIEAYEATNGFEHAMAKWQEVKATTPDFYASSTGHGLGGMHSVRPSSPLPYFFARFHLTAARAYIDPGYSTPRITRRNHVQVR